MRIHKEGRKAILIAAFTAVGLFLFIHLLFTPPPILRYTIYGVLLLVPLFITFFFRVPGRKPLQDDSKVVSGADGKIVAIETVTETEYFKDQRIMVSVFMSVFNVHVNYLPVSGRLAYYRHHHGKHLFAWAPKASTQNEHTTIVINHSLHNPILLRQIAGAFARRIVCNLCENADLTQGNELGIIKFGSRVDIYLPLSAKVAVQLDQKVIGGQTIIASF